MSTLDHKFKTTMTTKQLLQNIHYFYTSVLENAGSRTNWDDESITKAMDWSLYCTNVHKRCNKSALQHQLDELLLEMFALDPRWSGPTPSTDMLQEAPKHLTMALLQNPMLSIPMKTKILSVYSRKFDLNHLSNDLSTLVLHKEAAKLTKLLLPSLKMDIATHEYDITLCAKKLLCLADASCFQMNSKIRAEIKQVAMQDSKLLLEAALVDDDDHPSSCLRKIIVDWFIEQPHSFTSEHVWSQPPQLLTRIAIVDETFTEKYLEHLEYLGSDFISCQTENTVLWKSRNVPTYEDFVSHFLCLRSSTSQRLRLAAEALLDKGIFQASSSIWFDVKKDSEPPSTS